MELKRVEIEQDKRRRIHKWDHYLKKFEYVKALDSVLVVSDWLIDFYEKWLTDWLLWELIDWLTFMRIDWLID